MGLSPLLSFHLSFLDPPSPGTHASPLQAHALPCSRLSSAFMVSCTSARATTSRRGGTVTSSAPSDAATPSVAAASSGVGSVYRTAGVTRRRWLSASHSRILGRGGEERGEGGERGGTGGEGGITTITKKMEHCRANGHMGPIARLLYSPLFQRCLTPLSPPLPPYPLPCPLYASHTWSATVSGTTGMRDATLGCAWDIR